MSAFNAHHIALGCAAVVLFIIGALIIFARSSKRGASTRAVERLRNLPGRKPVARPPAASPEMLLLIGDDVPPNLEHSKPLEVQTTANTSQTVSAAAQPTLGHAEPLVFQADICAEAAQPVGAHVRSFLEHAGPLEVQPAATRPKLPLPRGSKVWVVRKFGSVPKGTPGIVTGTADGRFIWQSPMYLCTFADNRKARAHPRDIEACNHAHSLQELEQPNLGAIQSRHMVSRAQQLISRQRPTHPTFAVKTKSP